ncbi:glycoside hydrolase family 130 protein [Gaopeijia maritima]|uniref:glycoside hydrolase family 130 protein n=1 Tax=Gaopeijia maritima TaxID=3119007 RepID=UPI003243B106
MRPGPAFVETSTLRLLPDRRRVITKPFLPGEETHSEGRARVRSTVVRILSLPEADVGPLLERLRTDFSSRHRDFEAVLRRGFERVAGHLGEGEVPTAERQLLIGAFLTHEFSIQAAAFFNPSMVPAPDQSGLKPGELRVVMSGRSVGEGHLSSIEFRTVVVDAEGTVEMEPPGPWASTGTRRAPTYEKRLFLAKLIEMAGDNTAGLAFLAPLPDSFTREELVASIAGSEGLGHPASDGAVRLIEWLASSNYVVSFDPGSRIDERVLFPAGPTESRGMEDARFVRFIDDDGSVTYYATYTAFDGTRVLPQSIETSDFASFRVATVSGSGVANKGTALFPRRIDGRYAMLSRLDSENIYVTTSDDVRHWDAAHRLEMPIRPWSLIQRGNCGSPIETEAGWLVLTHGVGPMRTYSIGAMLLDIADPRRVIAHLPDPILTADGDLRDGYVPNVVYSCGSVVHQDHLVLPYGFSDFGIGFARLSLSALLEALRGHPV